MTRSDGRNCTGKCWKVQLTNGWGEGRRLEIAALRLSRRGCDAVNAFVPVETPVSGGAMGRVEAEARRALGVAPPHPTAVLIHSIRRTELTWRQLSAVVPLRATLRRPVVQLVVASAAGSARDTGSLVVAVPPITGSALYLLAGCRRKAAAIVCMRRRAGRRSGGSR